MSDTDLKEKELNPGAHDDLGTPQERAEAEAAGLQKQFDDSPNSGNPDGGFDKGKVGQKRKGRLSGRQKGIMGGIAGLLIGGSFATFGILQGPLQLIHIAQLLQRFHFSNSESITDSRTGRLIAYINSRNTPERRNLNFAGNQMADIYQRKLERAGLEFSFDEPSGRRGRRITGVTIDLDKPGGLNSLESLKSRGIDVSGIDVSAGGRQTLSLDTGRGSTEIARNAVKGLTDSLDLNRVSGALGSRLLIHRARVDFSPFRNRRIENRQDRDSYTQAVKDEIAEGDRNGVDPPEVNDLEAERGPPDDEGNVPDPDPDLQNTADEANGLIDEAQGSSGDGPDGIRQTRARFSGLIRGGGIAAAGVGVICAARELGDQSEQIQHANIFLPLIRMGTRTIAMGNQIMSGNNINLDEIGVIVTDFYDEETQTSLLGAKSIQAELGEPQNGVDIKPEAKPAQVGDKPVLFDILDNGAFDVACGVNNVIGNIPVLKQVGELSDSAVNAVLSPLGISPEQLMEGLASYLAGDSINVFAAGAELGNYVNYGAFLAANDVMISMGGRALGLAEVGELDAQRDDEIRRLNQQKSLYARYFDLNDMDSLARQVAISVPANKSEVVTSSLNSFANLPSLFAQFISPVSAQESYSYGVDEFGFSVAELENELVEDPYQNAEIVEEIGVEELSERYRDCFSMSVDDNGNISAGESSNYADIEGGDCDGSSEEFLRYRFYLLDSVVGHSLMCYEGVTASCNQLGMSGDISTGTTELGGELGEPTVGNTADVPCAPGTTDLGETDGYNGGERYTIRLCHIPDFESRASEDDGSVRVNSVVSQNWLNLFLAAQNAGVRMVASSTFRDMEKQEYLYNCYQSGNCNGGREAARPGYSNHQIGMAIDIDIVEGASDPSLVTCQARPDDYPTYQWLATNAARFGMSAEVESECWHWSPTGN